MRKGKLALVGVLAVSIALASGCSPKTTSSPEGTNGASQGEQTANVMPTTVYVADQNGFVVPLQVKIEKTDQIALGTLKQLITGGSGDASLVSSGFQNVLPKGTEIRGISINDGVAKVDLTKQANSFDSALAEQRMVEGIVWSLTGLDGIKKVQLMIDGHVQPTLKNGTPVGEPISRANGINLQVMSNVSPSQSTAVTLYFLGKSNDAKFSYLVPMTRMVPQIKDQNRVELTVAELAKGPNSAGLEPLLSPDLKLAKSSIADRVANLEFSQGLIKEGADAVHVINSIVLSLSANAGVEKVMFTVGEKAPATGGGLDLSKPVSVPPTINEHQM